MAKLKNMRKNKILLFLLALVLLGVILVLSIVLANFRINQVSKDFIFYDINQIPNAQAVLILGAKAWPNEVMSDILHDRALTGLEVYKAGKVEKILISGDHGQRDYDEVNIVKSFLLESNAEPQDIFLDHAGFDTYDSLYRARDIFKIKSIIIATQNFHLPRAVYIAKKLGLNAYGLSSDKHIYLGMERIQIREALAKVKAVLNIFLKSKPKYLGEIISIQGDGQESWD